jgi:hypothetical protein
MVVLTLYRELISFFYLINLFMNNIVWFFLLIGFLSFQIQIKYYIWAMIIIYYS